MKYLKIFYRLLVYLASFTGVFSGDIKKEKKISEKKSSENDQSTGHFQSFFCPLDPKSEKKNPVNQLIKKFWPKTISKRNNRK